MTNIATLYFTRTLAPGIMTFIILLEHSLLFIIMYSICQLDVLVKKESFNEKHKFYSFYPKIKAPYVENHEI